jgi:peptide/nickel transport system substrate-binding protein
MSISRREFVKLGLGIAVTTAFGRQFVKPTMRIRAQGAALNIGATNSANTLDPHGSSFFQIRQVYDTLLTWSNDGQLVGELAEGFTLIDPMTIEVKVKEGVKFSNGEDLTAETVKFNVDRIINSQNPAHQLTKLRLLTLGGAEVVNDYTVRISARFPDPVLAQRLTQLYIVPQGFTQDNSDDLTAVAAGTGVYRVTEFVPGQRTVFEDWGGSWRGAAKNPTATYVAIPDPAGLQAALQTGEIDAALSLPKELARRMTEGGDYIVTAIPSLGCDIVSLLPTVEPALGDIRVRRALNLAVNKQEYVDVILSGYGRVADGQLLSPEISGYNDEIDAFPFDPEQAINLLNEAGVANLTLNIATTIAFRNAAEAIAGYWAGIGVNAQVEVQELSSFVQTVQFNSTVPALFWTPFYTRLRDWSEITRFAPPPPSQQVQPHFESAAFTEVQMKLMQTFEPAEREALIKQAQKIMHDEAAAVFLAYPDIIWTHSTRIANLPVSPDASLRMWEVEKEA